MLLRTVYGTQPTPDLPVAERAFIAGPSALRYSVARASNQSIQSSELDVSAGFQEHVLFYMGIRSDIACTCESKM